MKKKVALLCAFFMMVLMLVISPEKAFALEVEAIEDPESIEEEIALEEETEEVIAEEESEDVDLSIITSCYVNGLDKPVEHEYPDFSVFTGSMIDAEIHWYRFGSNGIGTEIGKNDEFLPDVKYGCRIYLRLSGDYRFQYSLAYDEYGESYLYYSGTLKINYETMPSKSAIIQDDGKTLMYMYCWAEVPDPLEKIAVTSVDITGVTEPVVGQHPSYVCNWEGAKGDAIILNWYKMEENYPEESDKILMSEDEVFEEGVRYGLEISLFSFEDTYFPGLDDQLPYVYDSEKFSMKYDGIARVNGENELAYTYYDFETLFIRCFWYKEAKSNAPKIASVKLSETSYEYDGTAKTPKVIVKDTDGEDVSTDYYTVKRSSGRKEVGTYTYKVVFNAPISKTFTLTFKILPAKVATVKTENTSSGIKVSWSAAAGATKYIVYRSDNGGSYTKVYSTTSRSFTDTTANVNGRKYAYKVYSYNIVDGVGYKGAASSAKTYYFIKRPAISSFTSTSAMKAVVKWSANTKATGYQIQYCLKSDYSSGAKTVTVSSASTVAKTLTSLTSGKRYYVRMRAYKTVGSAKYYSAWTGSKYVTVK